MQNAVVDVEVIEQQEVKCVTKMIFLSAVLFLLLLPFPSCRQAIQDNALVWGLGPPVLTCCKGLISIKQNDVGRVTLGV